VVGIAGVSAPERVFELLRQDGKFTAHEELEGGMNGYAFRATHVPLSTQVFLKICDADSDSKALFQEPQSLIAATKSSASRNLVRLLDAERLGSDFILMATEWADGGDLLQEIKKGIAQADAVRFAIEILHGITVLHSARLVHRDIKPANILLFWESGSCVPKVGDFGSAAALPEGSSFVSASRHSALYVPPEGWETPSAYGIPSDLYQVGIVLDEMVSGALPYKFDAYLDRVGKDEMKALGVSNLADMEPYDRSKLIDACISRRSSSRKILTMRPAQPYHSRSLKRVINKAIAPIVSQRFRTSTEFIAALQRVDVPNWRPTGDGYEALQWKSWDWKVTTSTSGLPGAVIRRRRPDSAAYRCWGGPYSSLLSAFTTVESFRP
jgi:serine/threonine protein kinase